MLQEKLSNYNIILASGSPRRQQFFTDLDIPFTIQLKEVEEIYPEELKGKEITDYLAILKSKPFDGLLKDNDLLITSDTIVWFEDSAIGKPKNTTDAYNMLSTLSGKMHQVITSISIKSNNFQVLIDDTTDVYFNSLSEEEINYYIKNYKPFDKAGAYGIQEWIGLVAIDKIIGSYYNVMGLPVHKLYKELMQL